MSCFVNSDFIIASILQQAVKIRNIVISEIRVNTLRLISTQPRTHTDKCIQSPAISSGGMQSQVCVEMIADMLTSNENLL